MAEPDDRCIVRRASHHIDPEASPHELLNDATEWLQYSRGLSELLADLVHEADAVDMRKVALSLEAIGAMTHMGVRCAAEAHARMSWERSQDHASPRADATRRSAVSIRRRRIVRVRKLVDD